MTCFAVGPFRALSDAHPDVNATLHIKWRSDAIPDTVVPKAQWGDLSFLARVENMGRLSSALSCVDFVHIQSAVVQYDEDMDVDDITLCIHTSAIKCAYVPTCTDKYNGHAV